LINKDIIFESVQNGSHIEICRSVCREYDTDIHYIQGDSWTNLKRLANNGELDQIHLALFDSAPDAEQIWREFRCVEDRFIPGSVIIVDDAVRGKKGRRIKPYLHSNPAWRTQLILAGNGLLIAVRLIDK
jgi:predicted O-methyltransferase YrrM